MKFDIFLYTKLLVMCLRNTDLFTICKEGIFVSVHRRVLFLLEARVASMGWRT